MLYTQLQSIQASKYHSGLCFSITNSENYSHAKASLKIRKFCIQIKRLFKE
jgi:hypothetical protein